MSSTKKIVAGCAVVVAVAVLIFVAVKISSRSAQQGNGTAGAGSKVVHTSGPVPTPPSRQHVDPFTTNPALENVLAMAPGSSSYAASVSAQAVATSVIHITNCRPYPEVSSVAVGQSVTVYNVDAKAHTLKDSAGSGFSLALPAKGTQTFTLKASNETGFTYTCDGTAAGVVVTAK